MFSIPNFRLRLLLGSLVLSLCSIPRAFCVTISSEDVLYPGVGVRTGQFHGGNTEAHDIKGTETQLQNVSGDGFNILSEVRTITTQNDMAALIPHSLITYRPPILRANTEEQLASNWHLSVTSMPRMCF